MNGSNHFPLFYSSTVQEIENNVPVFSLGYKMDVIKLGHPLSVGLLISRNLDRAWQLSHYGTYLLQWRSSHGQNAMKELQSHHNLHLLDYQTFPPLFHPLTQIAHLLHEETFEYWFQIFPGQCASFHIHYQQTSWDTFPVRHENIGNKGRTMPFSICPHSAV